MVTTRHVSVGDAPSVYHVAFDAEVGGHLCGTASAAVHQNFRSVDGREGLGDCGRRFSSSTMAPPTLTIVIFSMIADGMNGDDGSYSR